LRVLREGSALTLTRTTVSDDCEEHCHRVSQTQQHVVTERRRDIANLEADIQGVLQRMQERCKGGEYDNRGLHEEMRNFLAVKGKHQARVEELTSRLVENQVPFRELVLG
jgi:hypothetical protein